MRAAKDGSRNLWMSMKKCYNLELLPNGKCTLENLNSINFSKSCKLAPDMVKLNLPIKRKKWFEKDEKPGLLNNGSDTKELLLK
jgi:hypothetical protein